MRCINHHCTISRARQPRSAHPSSALFSEGLHSPSRTISACRCKSGPPVLAALCGVSQGALRPLLGQCASRNSRYLTLHHPRKCQWREDEEKPMRRARGGRLEAALARG